MVAKNSKGMASGVVTGKGDIRDRSSAPFRTSPKSYPNTMSYIAWISLGTSALCACRTPRW